MKEVSYDGPSLEQSRPESLERSRGTPEAPVLRTFHTDVTDLVQEGKTTKTAVILAEVKKRSDRDESYAQKNEDGQHLGRIIFLLTLVLAFGIGVGAYALIGTRMHIPFLPEENTVWTPEETSSDTKVTINSSSRTQLLAEISDIFGETTLAPGGMRTIIFTDSKGRAATTSAIFSVLVTKRLPQGLLRSLEESTTYHIYSTGVLVGLFELSSRSYPETFSEMLKWEAQMPEDLLPVLNPKMKQSDIAILRGRSFKDERILDLDARVLSDPLGMAPLAYTFLDQKTLIIAGGRDTLRMFVEGRRARK